jgi:hypothetical protein
MRAAFFAVFAAALASSAATSGSGDCEAEGREYPDGARIQSYRVTGIRTRTAVPVYVVCRGGSWIWPGTGEPVARVHR